MSTGSGRVAAGLPLITAEALNAALLRSNSATAVLEGICGGAVLIERLGPGDGGRKLDGGRAVHRRVRLVHGSRVLSEADLWYRADRLPADVARALVETEEPFGRVVRTLGLVRRTLWARICHPGEAGCVEHRAMLCTRSGEIIAEVHERYDWGLVGAA